jgi:hypothetical protein
MAATQNDTRPMQLIHGIALNGIGTLRFSPSEIPSLTVNAEPDALPLIKTEVLDGVLTINTRLMTTSAISYKTPPVYTVTAPTLTEFKLGGAARAYLDNLKTRRIEINLEGAGDIRLNEVELESLRIEVNGAGSITASGTCPEQDIFITGTGNFSGGALSGDTVQVQIPGAGRAKVNAAKKLIVVIAGVGTVSYVGNPELERNVGGLGVVRKA